MESKQSILFSCLCFAMVVGSSFHLDKTIIPYFHSRTTFMLHIFICDEKDSILLRRAEDFSQFLAVIFYNKTLNMHAIRKRNSGWFMDLTCDFNKYLFQQVLLAAHASFNGGINPKHCLSKKNNQAHDEVTEEMLGVGFVWLIRGELDHVLESLKKVDIGLSTDMVLAEENRTYYDVYKLTSKSEIKSKQIELLGVPAIRKRYDLEKNMLRAIFCLTTIKVNNNTRHLIEDRYYKPRFELLNRKYYVLIQNFPRMFNFTLDILRTESYGFPTDKGIFDGQIRDLVLKKGDFGVNPLGITEGRYHSIDYTAFLDIPLTFSVYFMEEKSFGGPKALSQPFSLYVWIGLLIVTVVSICITYLSQILRNSNYDLSDGCMQLVSLISSQGLANDFSGYNATFISFILLFFTTMLLIFYHTSIMNGLLSPSPTTIKTMEDVMTKRNVRVANISYLTTLFFHPLVLKKMEETREERYGFLEGISRLQNDKTFALVADHMTMNEAMHIYYTEASRCNKREIVMFNIYLSSVLPKHSHYRELIMQGELRLAEHGIVKRETNHWELGSPQCLVKSYFYPVSIQSIFIGLFTYLLGIVFSMIILIIEMIKKVKP